MEPTTGAASTAADSMARVEKKVIFISARLPWRLRLSSSCFALERGSVLELFGTALVRGLWRSWIEGRSRSLLKSWRALWKNWKKSVVAGSGKWREMHGKHSDYNFRLEMQVRRCAGSRNSAQDK